MIRTLLNTISLIERRTGKFRLCTVFRQGYLSSLLIFIIAGRRFVGALLDLSHQKPSTKLVDDMSDLFDQTQMNTIEIMWFGEVSSTMDKVSFL